MSEITDLFLESLARVEKPLFLGRHYVKVDEKHRIAIPRDYQRILESRILEDSVVLYLSAGRRNDCQYLACYDAETFKSQYLAEEIRNLRGNPRLFDASNTFKMQLDNHGRITVPEPLRDYLALDDCAVILAAPNMAYLEIWAGHSVHNYRHEPQLDHEANQVQILRDGDGISLIV